MEILKTVAGIFSYLSFGVFCVTFVDFFVGLGTLLFSEAGQDQLYYYLIGSAIIFVLPFIASIIVFIVSTYFFLHNEEAKKMKR